MADTTSKKIGQIAESLCVPVSGEKLERRLPPIQTSGRRTFQEKLTYTDVDLAKELGTSDRTRSYLVSTIYHLRLLTRLGSIAF